MAYSFSPTPAQGQRLDEARRVARKWVAPRAAEIDERNEVPRDLLRKLHGPPCRYAGVYVPPKYGGRGFDWVSLYLVTEEFARWSATVATLLEVPGLVSTLIQVAGTEEQKRRFLGPIALGKRFPCFALTERQAGTDAAAIATRAEKRGGRWVLRGAKYLVSFGDFAGDYAVFARTGPRAVGIKGISLFLVPRETPGVALGKEDINLGMHGHRTWRLGLRGAEVGPERLLGEPGMGFIYAMRTLDRTRATLAAILLGVTRALLETATEYARERKTFGKPLLEHEAVGFPLAECRARYEAATLLGLRSCWSTDRGETRGEVTSMAKALAAEVVLQAGDAAARAMGAAGTSREFPLERYLRDARTFVLAQGSPEAQKLVLAKWMLKGG